MGMNPKKGYVLYVGASAEHTHAHTQSTHTEHTQYWPKLRTKISEDPTKAS